MEEQSTKSLDTWAQEIRDNKQSWLAFYETFLGRRASSIPRLYRTVNLYGFWPVFESIIESSTRDLGGDPLNYVVKVAANKWREAREAENEEIEYANAIQKSKAASKQANLSLEKKLTKRKR
jgi:hypothetical protein